MQLDVNGEVREVEDRHSATPLLWVLRDVLGVHSVKFGCGGGFCAACTVLLDGRAVKACQMQAGKAVGLPVVTAGALRGPRARAVRDAWYAGNVVQCGYCQPGQQCSAVALLGKNPTPDDAAIDTAMAGNLCRCGTYPRIRAAIHQAAEALAASVIDEPAEWEREVPPTPQFTTAAFNPGSDIDAYLTIAADGTITVACSQIEMGQGAHTGVATIVAEELDADLSQLRVVHAANNPSRYGNTALGGAQQLTAGSTSTGVFWERYRQVAAAARARLIAAAAAAWNVAAAEIDIRHGVLTHPAGHRAGFGEFARAAAELAVPEGFVPKQRAEYRLIGSEGILRVDSPAKILGTAQYTIDVTWPGMMTALVLHPPAFGAKVGSVDDSAARAVPGVVGVVTIGRGVAVVGKTYYDAYLGCRALHVDWDDTDAELRSSDELLAEHLQLAGSPSPGAVAYSSGDLPAAMAAATRVLETTVDLPHVTSAPMEPNNAVCRMRDDGVVEIWSGSQAPDAARRLVSALLDVPLERVEVHVTYAGGGFGLRSADDQSCVVEAAEIARALDWKYPIKVQSSRQEEFKSGGLRSAAAVRIRAGVDEHGTIVAWEHRIVTQPVLETTDGVDPLLIEGAVSHPYELPNQHIEMVEHHSGVPVLTWRGIGTVPNDFARETLIDEIAEATAKDPIELRRELIADTRTRRVLDLLIDRAGPVAEGRSRGVAVSAAFGTPSAQLIEISEDERGRIRIERVVLVADPGTTINPDMVRSQLEGGIVFGLSAALWGQITLRNGEVVQQNFDQYQIARMRNMPDIDVHLASTDADPGGVGEVSVSTVAPALVNAIAALCGTRIRSLPITKSVQISPSGGRRDTATPITTATTASTASTASTATTATTAPTAPTAPTAKGNPMPEFDVDITTTENGPYRVAGAITVHDHDGRTVDVPGDEIYLCRCGGSGNKPFCDGTHATIDFDGTLAN